MSHVIIVLLELSNKKEYNKREIVFERRLYMKKLFKTISICSLSLLAGLSITACGSKKTTKNVTTKSVTTKEKEGDCAINVEGAIDGVKLEFTTTKMVDGQVTPVVLDINKKYDAGTILFIRVTNNSDKKVKFSALEGNLIAGRDYIDANGLGGLMGIELTKTLKFKVEDATSIQTATLDIIEDETADTETKINSVHVYSDSFLDKPDFTVADKLEIGEKIKVYVWNCASDVSLTITNGTNPDDEIVKEYEVLTEDQQGPDGKGHDEFIEVTVKGNITVEIECLGGKIEYDFSSISDVEANVTYLVDELAEPIKSGDNVCYGTEVSVETINNSTTNKYILLVSDSTSSVVKSAVINPDMTTITKFILRDNLVTIELIEYTEISFELYSYSGVTLTAQYLDGDTLKDVDEDVPFGSLVNVTVENNNDDPVILYINKYDPDLDVTETSSRKIDAKEKFTCSGLIAINEIEVNVREYTEHEVQIVNSFSIDEVMVKAYVMYLDTEAPIELKDGDKVVDGGVVMVAARKLADGDYAITIHNGSEVVSDNTKISDYTAPYILNAAGTVYIKVSYYK